MCSVKNEISKNLAYYRKSKKITQKELAEKLGVKHNTISGWENGANSIDVEILCKICSILEISIAEIYGKYASSPIALSVNEQELIKKYRALDERGKGMVDIILNTQYEQVNPKIEDTAM